MLKKIIFLLVAGMSMTTAAACGRAEKKPIFIFQKDEINAAEDADSPEDIDVPLEAVDSVEEKEGSLTAENRILQDNSSDPEESTVQGGDDILHAEEKVTPKKNLNMICWSDEGIFAGKTSLGRWAVFDQNGNYLYTLRPDEQFAYDADDVFHYGYAKMTNGTIIDTSGAVVYDPAQYGYDKIEVDKALDAGFIICSREENSFNDSAVHYFVVNLKDGSTWELIDPEKNPMAKIDNEDWYYLGEGYFLRDHWSKTLIYNLADNTAVTLHRLANDEKIPYVSVHESIYDEYHFYYGGSYVTELLYSVDVHDGIVEEYICANGAYAYPYGETQAGMFRIRHVDDYEVPYNILLDPVTGKEYPMSLYSDFEVLRKLDEERILCKVQNKDEDYFVTVVNKDGTYAFEPVPCERDSKPWGGEAGFAFKNGDGGYSVYDITGRMLGTSYGGSVHFSGNTILYIKADPTESAYVLYDAGDGSETVISKDAGLSSYSKMCSACCDGYLFQNDRNEGVFIRCDGSYVFFEEPEA